MAEQYGVIAQSNPVAATDTDIFTVLAATRAVVSSINIANRSASPVACRLWFAPLGVATADAQYIYFDVSVPANDALLWGGGATFIATDVIRGRAASQQLSFTVNGIIEDAP